ncbi:MAG: beta-lactamase family protein [Kangiellaceae bacterium]|nr:beta-lactamase family protein [Kangiellaceae bacterium]MCW8997349.1 beta-lactamase family protein [Kangiellaceae bacterium]
MTPNRLLTFLLLLLQIILCAVLLSCGGSSQNTTTRPLTIQDILDNGVSQGIDGILVYVEKTGESPLSFASGLQNRTNTVAASPEALFKIASISKLFIAVASVKLIREGLINPDDTLAYWLPDISIRIANSQSITIQNLLQHRSGVPDFDSQVGFSWQDSHTNIDNTLEFVLGLPADFAPDTRFEYSNTNYLLIGKILDTALGYSHQQYIRDNILLALDMTNSYSLLSEVDLNLMSRGYWIGQDRLQQDYVIPGGSMISTVEDIGVFIRGLATGTLLSSEEKMIYDQFFPSYAHSGWLPGYQSIARYHANIDTVIVQFVNTTGDNSESISSNTYEQLVDFFGG